MGKLQVKAVFLSVIMLLMMMHDAFPHTHHHNELEHAKVEDGNHHHHHHGAYHHHPEQLPDTEDTESLLGLLFKSHSHNSREYHVAVPAIQFPGCKAQFLDCFISSGSLSYDPGAGNILVHYFPYCHSSLEKACLNANSLRAPPALG